MPQRYVDATVSQSELGRVVGDVHDGHQVLDERRQAHRGVLEWAWVWRWCKRRTHPRLTAR
jgi:hypothetical protein